MKQFLIFSLAAPRCGEIGASKNFIGAYETAKEVEKVKRESVFVEVYDGQKERFLDVLEKAED